MANKWEKMAQMCPACGHINNTENKFCGECGKQIKKSRKLAYSIAVVFSLLIFGLAILLNPTRAIVWLIGAAVLSYFVLILMRKGWGF
jgi:uncharacterized membrane protein YvbJ